jgi:hypothetical protein
MRKGEGVEGKRSAATAPIMEQQQQQQHAQEEYSCDEAWGYQEPGQCIRF